MNSLDNINVSQLSDYAGSHYRPDIDGLRAIAVLAVIAYHFNIGPVPGGFTGVDIFFVISGFLITGNIVSRLDGRTFSFVDFYQRRIRRIFPPLILLLAAYFAAGWLVIRGDEAFSFSETPFTALCQGIEAGAAFVMNFFLMREVNYFFPTLGPSALIHLWSLAIEEQFYIIWPLALYVVNAMRLQYLPCIIVVGAVSFAINIIKLHGDPMAAFYSPLSRAWELMIGASLSAMPTKRMPDLYFPPIARSIAGFLLIFAGLFGLKGGMAFPGWAALLPTVGATLVISAGPNAAPNKRLLGSSALVWVGLLSYSLYLWHWPAHIIFDEYSKLLPSAGPERPILKGIVLLCAVLASWLTFHFVEIPFRFGRWRDTFHTVAAATMMAILGLSAALAPRIQFNVTQSQSDMLVTLKQVAQFNDFSRLYGDFPCLKYLRSQTATMFLENGCVQIRHPGAKSIFIIGDSHSGSLALGLRPPVESRGVNFLQVSTGYCEPTSTDISDTVCQDINDMVMRKIAELKPDVVIYDSYWQNALNPRDFSDLLAKLNQIKKSGAGKIILVGEIPVWRPSLPESLALNFVRWSLPIPRRTLTGVDRQSLEIDTKMRAIEYPPSVTYLSMKDDLCDNAGCLTMTGSNVATDLIVWDYGHLTAAGAAWVSHSLLEPALWNILQQ